MRRQIGQSTAIVTAERHSVGKVPELEAALAVEQSKRREADEESKAARAMRGR